MGEVRDGRARPEPRLHDVRPSKVSLTPSRQVEPDGGSRTRRSGGCSSSPSQIPRPPGAVRESSRLAGSEWPDALGPWCAPPGSRRDRLGRPFSTDVRQPRLPGRRQARDGNVCVVSGLSGISPRSAVLGMRRSSMSFAERRRVSWKTGCTLPQSCRRPPLQRLDLTGRQPVAPAPARSRTAASTSFSGRAASPTSRRVGAGSPPVASRGRHGRWRLAGDGRHRASGRRFQPVVGSYHLSAQDNTAPGGAP